jgi:2-polyprenyl-3-methyl-5-hydroxy-6-metoxy-1,4-benzoquinol methylase
MITKREIWEKITPKELANKLNQKTLECSSNFQKILSNADCILDFGCGVGRNVPNLKKLSKEIHAYDMPVIVEFLNKEKIVDFATSEWDKIKNNTYDFIVACLVFQHMDYSELIDRLIDMRQMTKKLWVASRTWMDDKDAPEVATIIENCNWIPILKLNTNSKKNHWQAIYCPND